LKVFGQVFVDWFVFDKSQNKNPNSNMSTSNSSFIIATDNVANSSTFSDNSTENTNRGNPLLTPNSHKYVVFASTNSSQSLSKVVTKCDEQEANLWLASEIVYHDKDQFDKMTEPEKNYLKQVLAFFASSDGIVGENLALNFIKRVQIPEVRYFYYFQSMMEAVHSKVYSNLITAFITSSVEREQLFDSINTNPIIKKKADWCLKWMDNLESENPKEFFRQLVAFLAVEGIFFSGSFASIFWLRDRGILSNSLGVANELISRDETLHADFACLLVNEFGGDDRPSDEEITEILVSALNLEKEFIKTALPDKLFGMNQELMSQYLEFITDMWLNALGVAIKFGTENPFPFMASAGQRRKDLFFEKTKTNYARSTVSQEISWENVF